MAGTVNEVTLLGRLTRDPEKRSFASGAAVVAFGFVVDSPSKNRETGAWEDAPVWLDCEAFVSADGKGQGSVVERFAKKGDRLFVKGHLRLDQWDDKTSGEKRSKLKVVVDRVTLVEKKPEGAAGGPSRPAARRPAPPQGPDGYDVPPDEPPYGGDIPF